MARCHPKQLASMGARSRLEPSAVRLVILFSSIWLLQCMDVARVPFVYAYRLVVIEATHRIMQCEQHGCRQDFGPLP